MSEVYMKFAKSVIQKIQNNLKREGFKECSNITQYEKSSMRGEYVFEVDDRSGQISFLMSSQLGYAKCDCVPCDDIFVVEWDWNDAEPDDIGGVGSRQYSSMSELAAFINTYFFYGYSILPSEEELENSNVAVVTVKFKLEGYFEEHLKGLKDSETLDELYEYLTDDMDLYADDILVDITVKPQ